VTAYKYLNPGAAIAMGLRYALTGGGSLAESYVATGGYMRSDPSLAVSDTIVVMIPALVTRRGVGFHLRDLFPERHGFTVMVGSGRPLSRGHILLRNADPTTHPLICPEYCSEPPGCQGFYSRFEFDLRHRHSPVTSGDYRSGYLTGTPFSCAVRLTEDPALTSNTSLPASAPAVPQELSRRCYLTNDIVLYYSKPGFSNYLMRKSHSENKYKPASSLYYRYDRHPWCSRGSRHAE